MKNINKRVQELIYSEKYYLSIKRKLNKNYWKSKKDPDGKIRDRIKNFDKERKIYLKNNKSLLRIIRSLKYNKLCDVGCGPGFLLSGIKNKKLFGIENDESAVKTASKYARIYKIDLNKKFKIKDKFDVVVCYHVIEHIKNPLTFLLNLKKILKKNGYLILGTPDFDSAMARRYKNKYRLLHDKTHISLFSLDSISRLLRKENFEIKLIDFPYFDTDYFNKKNLLRLFLTKKASPPFYGSFMTILSKINN
jgi:2-polyprenyl-3-methyl-5-hydroxy-6-metoxy-1,4-benzoquinol methylase